MNIPPVGPAASSTSSQVTNGALKMPNQPGMSVQEFAIRAPKSLKKRHHVMRFNATLNVDFAEWKTVKMERENHLKDMRGGDDDAPKFGAGSEYNRDFKDEVRRKKIGIVAKKIKPESQPWILKAGGKTGKKFRGVREGGVGENAAFYVFTHAPDGAIEAYPLHEWYNFQPIQRYKALSAEEAELEFGRRKKVLNYFSLMLRKRLKGDDVEAEEPEEVKSKVSKKSGELKISEMDDWMESDETSDSDNDETKEKSSEESKKKAAKKNENLKRKKNRKTDVEAFEESDDGDEEGRERDYISDSSDSNSEAEEKANKELKSVAEEDALRKLLTSDEDSEDEDKKSETSDKDESQTNMDGNEQAESAENAKKSKKKDSSSDNSSNSSDSEAEMKTENAPSTSKNAASTSQNNSKKRPHPSTSSEKKNSAPINVPAKKPKPDTSMPLSFPTVANTSQKDDFGITEEAVRRYLMRKPMTTTELLTKFKNKKTGVSSEKLVETMTQILKKINPVKQTIQGKMYLSIKVNK